MLCVCRLALFFKVPRPVLPLATDVYVSVSEIKYNLITSSLFTLVTFQVKLSVVKYGSAASAMDGAGVEHFHYHRNAYWSAVGQVIL